MWPGTSDTWRKAIFFAGLWVVPWYLMAGGIVWLIVHVQDSMNSPFREICTGVGFVGMILTFLYVPVLARLVHKSKRMETVTSWMMGCSFVVVMMLMAVAGFTVTF
jgi:hypothetical protein